MQYLSYILDYVNKPTHMRGFFSLAVAAVASIIVLLGAFAWKIAADKQGPIGTVVSAHNDAVEKLQQEAGTTTDWSEALNELVVGNTPASTTLSSSGGNVTDNLLGILLSGYIGLKESGNYNDATGAALINSVTDKLRAQIAYVHHDASELKTTNDISEGRALSYRADMRVALSPLLKNTEPPFATLGRYTVAGDKTAINDLKTEAANYRAAEVALAKVVVPKDAADIHVSAMNSLAYSAAVIDAMRTNADDPVAVAIMLKTYNDVESAVVGAFSNLAKYYVEKVSK